MAGGFQVMAWRSDDVLGRSNSIYPYKCVCGVTIPAGAQTSQMDATAMRIIMREDSGLLTNKSHLPVMQLRFGDNSDLCGQRGYHTMGKLRCYGSTSK